MNNEMILTGALPPSFDHLPAFKRWLMNSLAKVHHGKLFVHIDGHCYACGNDDSIVATLRIHQPLKMAWRCLAKGDLGFAESFLEGDWSSDDVTQLLKLFLKIEANWARLMVVKVCCVLPLIFITNYVKTALKAVVKIFSTTTILEMIFTDYG